MDVTLYRLVAGYQHSKGTCCLHPQGLNEWCEDAAMRMVNHTHEMGRGDGVIVTITDIANGSVQLVLGHSKCYVFMCVCYITDNCKQNGNGNYALDDNVSIGNQIQASQGNVASSSSRVVRCLMAPGDEGYPLTQHYLPKEQHPKLRCCKNLKTCKWAMFSES